MLISIKLCTHIGQIDGEVAEIPRILQLSQFILGNSLYIITLTVSAHVDITKFLRVMKWGRYGKGPSGKRAK
jgi:hypothetical protein